MGRKKQDVGNQPTEHAAQESFRALKETANNPTEHKNRQRKERRTRRRDSGADARAAQAGVNASVDVLCNAIQEAADEQMKIGAAIGRLEHTLTNLATAAENVMASESTIRDVGMVKEMIEYTKEKVSLQAARSMLAQMNQNFSSVMSRLQSIP